MLFLSQNLLFTPLFGTCLQRNVFGFDPKLISIHKPNIFALLNPFNTNLYSILHTFYDATQIKPEGEEEKSFM